MLIKNFYTILSVEQKDVNTAAFNVVLNKGADVYKGHFPQQPIAPGVCTLQMIKECLVQIVGCEQILLNQIRQCRFLKLLCPSEKELKITIELLPNNTFTSIITDDNVICFKLKAQYNKQYE